MSGAAQPMWIKPLPNGLSVNSGPLIEADLNQGSGIKIQMVLNLGENFFKFPEIFM